MFNFNQQTINNIKNSFGMESYTPAPTKVSKKTPKKVVKGKAVPLNPPKRP